MNLILLHPHELRNHRVELTGRRAQHIRKVLRCKPGDQVRVGVVDGWLGSGVITALSPDRVELAVTLTGPPPPAPPTDLILAVPRPIMLGRVLSQAASMGIGRIFLINANRVEKSFFNSSLMQSHEALTERLLLGLEQGIDTRLPTLSVHPRFRPFLEDILPPLLATSRPTSLLAHPGNHAGLGACCPPPLAGPAILAIGPEGGWVDFEVDRFTALGFKTFSLGPRILRVDTAVPALLSQLALLRQLPARQ
ncbi:MAG: 16S rRNA (uracil(1498)-N(3))-methyltransferase [Thermodesulfobacteriota bacterium]